MVAVQDAKRPWLSVYGGKLSGEPIAGSLGDFLEGAAERYRDNVALTGEGGEISYGELLALAAKAASALHEAGVKKGDRVGLMLPNCPEYVVAFFGDLRMGAATMQVNPLYVGRELEHIFSDSATETVVAHSAMYPKVKDVREGTPNKRWIGNATVADVIVVWARTEDGNLGGVLVEKGTPRPMATEITGKSSKRPGIQADITLDGVRAPEENRLPKARFFKDTTDALVVVRCGVAWEALGHAIASYETALAYAKERRQFGKPIASFQLVQDKIAKMLADISTMYLLCIRLVRLA